MQNATEEYKGFTIAVTPIIDNGDLWDYEYRITKVGDGGKDGDPAAAITRSRTAGGHATPETACVAGMQLARTEIDNLLAMSGGKK